MSSIEAPAFGAFFALYCDMRFQFFFIFFMFTCLVKAEVSTQELSAEAKKQVTRVPEFAYIQKAAEEIGVKVYLFGGSAAAYAHYVRWYIELQNGSENHQPERFDFDYTNIYRGNQDLDLVVDGTEAQAREFQRILQEKYVHIVGDKNDWEVRLLRAPIGDKLPLLDDPDFKNQHTDTNSTGMLELTASKKEPVFRDLLDWENEESQFLKDVSAARITYLFNKKHETTSRFKSGKNPSIFSAVRYLAKLTQYEVQGTKKDLATIRRIIQKTDFNKLSGYVKKKLEEFAKKALLNSPNSEYAWNLLEDLGLRKKLIEMNGNHIDIYDSLSWWMNKEPLRSKKLGTKGRTALKIFGKEGLIVSHETNSFQAYENITRSSRGEANAFISRADVSGEAAFWGDGFYTLRGLTGARGTGLTIRFKLHPKARENIDFIVEGDIIIVKNKKALTLIQENINISLTGFMTLLLNNNISSHDKGLLEKLNRKFHRMSDNSEELLEAVEFSESLFYISDDFPKEYRFSEIFLHTYSIEMFLQTLLKAREDYFNHIIPKAIVSIDLEVWKKNPHWISRLIELDLGIKSLIEHVLSDSYWVDSVDFIESIIDLKKYDRHIIEHLLSKKHWVKHGQYLDQFFQDSNNQKSIVEFVLSQEHWKHRLDLINFVIETGQPYEIEQVVDFVLSQPHMATHKKFLDKLLSKGYAHSLAKLSKTQQEWFKDPNTIKEIYSKSKSTIYPLLKYYFPQEYSKQNDDLLEEIFQTGDVDEQIAQYVLSKDSGQREELFQKILQKGTLSDTDLIKYIFSNPTWASLHKNWKEHIELMIKMSENDSRVNHQLIELVLTQKQWKGRAKDLFIQVFKHKPSRKQIYETLFKQSQWIDNVDLISQLIETKDDNFVFFLTHDFFSEPKNTKHHKLFSQLIKTVSYERYSISISSIASSLSKDHWVDYPYLAEQFMDKLSESDDYLYMEPILKQPAWFNKHKYLVEKLIEKGCNDIVLKIISNPSYPHPHPFARLLYHQSDSEEKSKFFRYILSEKAGLHYHDLFLEYLKTTENPYDHIRILQSHVWKDNLKIIGDSLEKLVLSLPEKKLKNHWMQKPYVPLKEKGWDVHPVLKDYVQADKVTLRNFFERVQEVSFLDWYKKHRLKYENLQCGKLL